MNFTNGLENLGQEVNIDHPKEQIFMKIVMINGQNHKGSTYHIGKMLADKVAGELTEFFLPRDFSEYCIGCTQCIVNAEEKCPGFEKQQPILKALDEADLIILTSPVYVYHVTGAMKNFLDHLGYRWMVHRPRQEMFHKQAVCISTAAGAGTKSTNQDMADSLFYWGVPKIYRIGIAVRAMSWSRVSDRTRADIDKKTTRIAQQIRKNHGKVHVGLKTKLYFHVMRMLQKKSGWCEPDVKYWDEMGWKGSARPWK